MSNYLNHYRMLERWSWYYLKGGGIFTGVWKTGIGEGSGNWGLDERE